MLLDHRSRRVAVSFSLAAALLSQAGASFAQTDEEKAAARALATQGADELKQNHFAQALDLVTRAQQLVHAPTHLLMIARAQVGLGKLVAAQESYLKLTREELAPTAPAAFRNAQIAARDELAAIEPRIGSLRIVLEGVGQKSVTVKLDEQPVPPVLLGVYRPIDPGPHVVTVLPAGQSPMKGAVDVHEGEKKEIKLAVPDAPPGAVPVGPVASPDAAKPLDTTQPPRDTTPPGFFTPLRGAGIGVGAVGIVGLVVGGVFFAKSGSTQSEANADATSKLGGCSTSNPSDCSKSTPAQVAYISHTVTPLDQSAASQKTIGSLGVAVGGAALVTGVVLIVVGKPKPANAAGIEPWFGGSAGGLRGTF